MENKKSNIRNTLIKIFWIFIIGSIIGCLVETVVCLVQKGCFEYRQGLIYGPFIPVYGVGTVIYYFIITRFKNMGMVFIMSMIIGGTVEYLFSYFQEIFFGTVSWDYSHLLFNIGGRTSLLHCIYWGIAGILFLKMIHPTTNYIEEYIGNLNFQYLTLVLTMFMVFNICISCASAVRQRERMNHIKAENNIDKFLDYHYPDWKMNKVFSNKINRDVYKNDEIKEL